MPSKGVVSQFRCEYLSDVVRGVAAKNPVCLVGNCDAVITRMAKKRLQYQELLPSKCPQCLRSWMANQKHV